MPAAEGSAPTPLGAITILDILHLHFIDLLITLKNRIDDTVQDCKQNRWRSFNKCVLACVIVDTGMLYLPRECLAQSVVKCLSSRSIVI
jgi:hypothetical protein